MRILKVKLFFMRTLFVLFFMVIANAALFSQQDTVVTANGQKIVCKIKEEDQESVKISFKKGDKTFYNKIQKSHISAIRYGESAKLHGEVEEKLTPRTWQDKTATVKLDILMPALGIEVGIGDRNTILFSYEPGFVFLKHNDDPVRTYVVSQFRFSPRFFTNIPLRQYMKKNTYKFSGNFVSANIHVCPGSDLVESYVVFGPTIGLQRCFGGIGHFSIEIGIGYMASGSVSGIAPLGDISLGFQF
jgi:hypothetical protein